MEVKAKPSTMTLLQEKRTALMQKPNTILDIKSLIVYPNGHYWHIKI